MTPQMNVKLDRAMVIKKLTDKIAAAKDKAAEIKKKEAAYEKEVQKWAKECEAIIKKNSAGIGDIDNYFHYNTAGKYYVKVQYLLDDRINLPQRPALNDIISYDRAMKQVKEMERMRDILILCTEDTISSKVYQSVLSYIID